MKFIVTGALIFAAFARNTFDQRFTAIFCRGAGRGFPVAIVAGHSRFAVFTALHVTGVAFNTLGQRGITGFTAGTCGFGCPLAADTFAQDQTVAAEFAGIAYRFEIACFGRGIAGFKRCIACLFCCPLTAGTFLKLVAIAVISVVCTDGCIHTLSQGIIANFIPRACFGGRGRPETCGTASVKTGTFAFVFRVRRAFGLGIACFGCCVARFRGQTCFFENIGIV